MAGRPGGCSWGGAAGPTLRSRLLRMHSAAKTCSPTLLSSSMAPRTRTHKGSPPRAPPPSAARARAPASPPPPISSARPPAQYGARAPGGAGRRGGVSKGSPQIPRWPMGGGGRGVPGEGRGQALSERDPSSSCPRGGGQQLPGRSGDNGGQWGRAQPGALSPGGGGVCVGGGLGGEGERSAGQGGWAARGGARQHGEGVGSAEGVVPACTDPGLRGPLPGQPRTPCGDKAPRRAGAGGGGTFSFVKELVLME